MQPSVTWFNTLELGGDPIEWCQISIPAVMSYHHYNSNELAMQAAQVRKVSFVPPSDGESVASGTYNPNTHQSCTIYGGTYVQQVGVSYPLQHGKH